MRELSGKAARIREKLTVKVTQQEAATPAAPAVDDSSNNTEE